MFFALASGEVCRWANYDLAGGDIGKGKASSEQECSKLCDSNSRCKAFSWTNGKFFEWGISKNMCYMKSGGWTKKSKNNVVSAMKGCGPNGEYPTQEPTKATKEPTKEPKAPTPAPRVCRDPKCTNPSRWAGSCCAPSSVSIWGWCGAGAAFKSGIDCSDCCGGRREGEDSVPAGPLELTDSTTVVNGEHVVEKSYFFVPVQVHQYAGAVLGPVGSLAAQTVFTMALLAALLAAGFLTYKLINRKETVHQSLLASKN